MIRKAFWCCLVIAAGEAGAGQRESGRNDAALLKLQTALRATASERDAVKAEAAKLSAETATLRRERDAAQSAKAQLESALTAARQTGQALTARHEATNAQLIDALEKGKDLSQIKANLSKELAELRTRQEQTAQQLNLCGEHNAKLVQSARELLDRYEHKGALSSLLQDEPLLQIRSVQMEGIVQQYTDSIDTAVYKAQ